MERKKLIIYPIFFGGLMKFISCILLFCSSLLADFNVTLSDAVFRNAEVIVKAISNDGRFILTGNFGPANRNIPEVELYENVNGKLVSKVTLPYDNFAFNGVFDDCFVDENFETFGVLDNNGSNIFRLRILKINGNSFKVIRKVIYKDGFSFLSGGAISGDGKFVMLGYTNNQSTSTKIISTVKLLNIQLKTLQKFTIDGLSNGLFTFVLNQDGQERNYFLSGFSGFNPTSGLPTPPAFLQIYKVSGKKLDLVDQAELPQFPPCYFADSHNTKNPRIIVGTSLPLNAGEISIFQDTSGTMTFIPGDNHNIREYRFNGKTLSLITSMATDDDVVVSNFYKDGKTIGINKSNAPFGNIPPNTWNLTFLKTDEQNQFKCVDGALTIPDANFFPLFSKNGKYFVCGGVPVATTSGSPRGIFNLNLFKVTD